MPRIICAGLIAADLVFDVAEFPVKGTKNRATGSHMTTGGGALNAASTIASLGGDASLAGAIGDDASGAFLRKKMADRRIDDQFVSTIPRIPTSRSANMLTPDGDRTVINHRDSALIPCDFALPPEFQFDAALVDTRWSEGAALIVKAARRIGKPAVVDAEAPVAHAAQVLALASHVVFSEQGLADYCGGSDAAALTLAQKRLGNWCAVTRGPLPVLCHDGRCLTEIPTYPTTAVNTLGAGDVWHGAFALALSNGCSENEAVHWANAAASLKVSRPIHDETLPTAAEVDALLGSGSTQSTEGSQ
ncbi:PfkB family carbohydrate kinase [uncultured Boseongicola sp.]|jgi:sulfofructose kinase|uniref:PfkB family carbohydrate kinase n=1 Tax=uncultured Boseongicola sp. TaxID=1648499 RepID=UPI002639C1FB|nr:PfkB family carbohydrate kinase [uncultured Boseongicola sp.]